MPLHGFINLLLHLALDDHIATAVAEMTGHRD
jgi:hypothetical protein